jgi:Fe-S-cluster containining protein
VTDTSLRRRRLTLAEAQQTPCFSCSTSPCCTHLPLHRFTIRTLVDLDHAIYLLNFDRIELGISPSGEWSIFYAYPCRFLDTRNPANYLCTIHGSELQPQICVHYNPYSCWYRKSLGADSSADLLRVDRTRMAWIAERIEFDDDRVIIGVPTWAEMAEMCARTPLASEPVAQPPPEADPVFERWLEETAAGPSQARPEALRMYQEFLDRCTGCEAYCCKTLVFPHGRPASRANLDYLQFALGFPGVEVGVSDGAWQLIVKTTCRHLTADNRCGVFGQPSRPMLCKYYDAASCSYVVQFGQTAPPGFLRVQLEQLYWMTETVRFADDGTITQLPSTEELRAHVEGRWSETVAAQLVAAPEDEVITRPAIAVPEVVAVPSEVVAAAPAATMPAEVSDELAEA